MLLLGLRRMNARRLLVQLLSSGRWEERKHVLVVALVGLKFFLVVERGAVVGREGRCMGGCGGGAPGGGRGRAGHRWSVSFLLVSTTLRAVCVCVVVVGGDDEGRNGGNDEGEVVVVGRRRAWSGGG